MKQVTILSVFILVVLFFGSCEKEQENMIQEKQANEVNNLCDELEEINNAFISSRVYTRVPLGWFGKALIIAGADIGATVGTLAGAAAAINVGLLVPPGQISLVVSCVVTGAGGSLVGANKVGWFPFSTDAYTTTTVLKVGKSYISESFPVCATYGLDVKFPHDYDFLKFAGPLHNDAVKRCLGNISYKEFTGAGGAWVNTCLDVYGGSAFNRRYIDMRTGMSQLKTFSNIQSYYDNVIAYYKSRQWLNDYTSSFLRYYLDAYVRCGNIQDVKELTENYIGFLWSRKSNFTEAEFQAFLMGFSVAIKSPYVWAELKGYTL